MPSKSATVAWIAWKQSSRNKIKKYRTLAQPAHQADATARIQTTAPWATTGSPLGQCTKAMPQKTTALKKNYIGLTNQKGSFKEQYTQHKLVFWNRNYMSNSTDRLHNQIANSHCHTHLQQQNKERYPLFSGEVSCNICLLHASEIDHFQGNLKCYWY